jgi:parvulin-like peptidyl-prolyl isomerase
MQCVFALLCAAALLQAEVVDRIAITVGQQAITALHLDEELRVAALLNGQPVVRDREARKTAADRLVEQLLIEREMKMSRYPAPAETDVDKFEAQVRAALPGAGDFEEKLRRYDLTESILREHLAVQLTTLDFIESRFRPELGVSPADIESYYQGELLRWKAEHPGVRPPTLAASRESIRKTLAERRTDEALDAWLKESRKQVQIVYVDKTLE